MESMLEENLERWKENYKAQAMAEGEAKGKAEGIAEGEAKAARESLLDILKLRFGQLPDNLTSTIANISDYTILRKLLNLSLKPETLQEFTKFIPRDVVKCQ